MNNTPYHILIKFPTRGRVEQFFKVLDIYYSFLDRSDFTSFLISCDEDDLSMNNDAVRARVKQYSNLLICYGTNKSKIEAVNADIEKVDQFDIILLASDDMIPQVKGYDTIIRNKMHEYFPDTDGILWFNDGYQAERLNTLSILGRKYYQQFNYLYHPAYKSLWCDNEFMEVGNILGRQIYFDQIIIKHFHPDIDSAVKIDELYERNLKLDSVDRVTFERRKKEFFGLGVWHKLRWKITKKFNKFSLLGNRLLKQFTDEPDIKN